MQCIKSTRYSTLINGQTMGRIRPLRGIREDRGPIIPLAFHSLVKGF
jgi:hypothetical protein